MSAEPATIRIAYRFTFQDERSYDEVDVTVDVHERRSLKHASVQQALSANALALLNTMGEITSLSIEGDLKRLEKIFGDHYGRRGGGGR